MTESKKTESMKPVTVYIILLLMFVLTAAYSYFVLLSTYMVHAIMTEEHGYPGALFSIMIRPYIFWILVAWVSFSINTGWLLRLIKSEEHSNHIHYPIIHLIWVATAFITHLTALFSPFISYSKIIG